jgi:hypothetical protein
VKGEEEEESVLPFSPRYTAFLEEVGRENKNLEALRREEPSLELHEEALRR